MKHLAFVDDDPAEIETFRRLYEGSRFRVTAVVALDVEDGVTRVVEALAGQSPDLFVLDLYFPASRSAPAGFDVMSASELAALARRLDDVQAAVETARVRLRDFGADGKGLLRDAHGVVLRAGLLLDAWCTHLQQSAAGGLKLAASLSNAFPQVPKVFYSRKATIADVKPALEAGAVDVISKPDPTHEAAQAGHIGDAFVAYAERTPPAWLRQVTTNLGLALTSPDEGVLHS